MKKELEILYAKKLPAVIDPYIFILKDLKNDESTEEYVCFCRYFISLSQVRYEHPHQKSSIAQVVPWRTFYTVLQSLFLSQKGIHFSNKNPSIFLGETASHKAMPALVYTALF